MMLHASRSRRALRCALAVVLACGLAPSAAFAQPSEATPDAAVAPAQGGEPAADEPAAVPGQALVLYRASSEAGARSADAPDAAALSEAGFGIAQEWDVSTVDRALEQGIAARDAGEPAHDALPSGDDLRIALVERAGADAETLVAELEELDFVVAAQPNFALSVGSASVNDTFYDDWQYAMTSESAGIDLEAALAARGSAVPDERNVVAVIDTGVDASHPDLADVMWRNPGIDGLPGAAGSCGYDFACNDDDPTPGTSSGNSHGTHCAGIIAGAVNNGEGIAGASADTQVMALKVTADEGDESLHASSIVSSYAYVIGAALAGEHVVAVNGSWVLSAYQPVLDYLVNQAGKLGILSLLAAGNNDSDTAADAAASATAGLQSPYAVVVASTNEQNALSTFSNYNATEVDVAFPGSDILSTVSTEAAGAFFAPSVSLAAGKDLAYVNDFSDFSTEAGRYAVTVQNSDGSPAPSEVAEAFDIAPVEDAGHGQPGLKVTFDPTGVDTSNRYRVLVEWDIDNPFFGSPYAAEDYALGVTGSVDQGCATDVVAQYGAALATERDGELIMLQGSRVGSVSLYDNFSIAGTSLASLDTESPTLRARLQVSVMTDQGTSPDERAVVYVEPYGVGLVSGAGASAEGSDYAPYGLMSGTSMATPLAAGTVAQLTALDPDTSALELRGRLVGSTVPVETILGGSEKHTATDGRFDWNVALDEDAVSASTWSVDADAASRSLVVRGYGLDDVAVSFDGSPAVVTERARDRVAVSVPADAFDGSAHRLDVTDASTGRTHRAAYRLPARDASYELTYAGTLPGPAEQAAKGMLVSAGDALYFADRDGGFLYRTARPGSDEWAPCAPAETPWGDEDSSARANVSYAANGNDLCAFTTDKAANGGVAVYAAHYVADADEWGPYELVDTLTSPLESTSMAGANLIVGTVGGTACALVGGAFVDASGASSSIFRLVRPSEGSRSFSSRELESGLLAETSLLRGGMVALDGQPAVLGLEAATAGDEDAGYALHAYAIDEGAGTVEDRGAIAGSQVPEERDSLDVLQAVVVPFGDKALVISRAQMGTGDTVLVDLAGMRCGSAVWLGSNSASGMIAVSGAVHEGAVHLSAIDMAGGSNSAAGALWTLPYRTAEELAGAACPTAGYSDLDPLAWYHEGVDRAVSEGVMTGIDASAGLFEPVRDLTRAEMAQVFYNLAGAPNVEGAPSFDDCAAGAWYQRAVAWCEQRGLFEGYGDGAAFGPDDALTREQFALVLWRFAGMPDVESGLSSFQDAERISDWALDAVEWAVAEGYLRGYAGTDLLGPGDGLQRAQAATIIMRAHRDGFPFPLLAE